MIQATARAGTFVRVFEERALRVIFYFFAYAVQYWLRGKNLWILVLLAIGVIS